jgi:hypothetical protein
METSSSAQGDMVVNKVAKAYCKARGLTIATILNNSIGYRDFTLSAKSAALSLIPFVRRIEEGKVDNSECVLD